MFDEYGESRGNNINKTIYSGYKMCGTVMEVHQKNKYSHR